MPTRKTLQPRYRRSRLTDLAILVGFAIFMAWSFVFMGKMFDLVSRPGVPLFAYEILAAVTGSFITVLATGTLLHFQSSRAQLNQLSEAVFLRKLQIYQDLLGRIFRADDDNLLTKEEILRIEDSIGVACLVANERVVALLSQFSYQIKVYGVVYFRSLAKTPEPGKPCPLEHFTNAVVDAKARAATGKETWLQCLPKDPALAANMTVEECFVSLDRIVQAIREDLQVVGGDIQGRIEQFMSIGYDPHGLIREPNVIEARPQ